MKDEAISARASLKSEQPTRSLIIVTAGSELRLNKLGQGRAPILREREHNLLLPLPLSLVESKLLLDVRYRSAENMLGEMNTVRKFN